MTTKAQAYNLSRKHEHDALGVLGWWPWLYDSGSAAEASAIASFQREHELTPDGAAGPAVFRVLRRLNAHERGWLPELPKGLPAIEATYGKRGKVKPVRVPIFNGTGRAVMFHPLLAAELPKLLELAAEMSGYTPKDVQTYNPRKKRGGDNPGTQWSTHSWPIAFDADPPLNPWGNKPGSPLIAKPEFLAVFRAAGWRCGADWKTPDTMHVQACWGY